jgi:hypothetical protein
MQIKKRVLCPERLRQVPPQFSWVDQRLVRHRYVQRCEPAALALYLVLVTVADAQGLSYYSDQSLGRLLRLDPAALRGARAQLVEAGLVVYQAPLYQVLALEEPTPPSAPTPRCGQTRSLKDILAHVLAEGGQP